MAKTGLAVSRFVLLGVSALVFLILSVGSEAVQGVRVPGAKWTADLHTARIQWHDPRPFDRDTLSKSGLDRILAASEGVAAYHGVTTRVLQASAGHWRDDETRVAVVHGDMFTTLGVVAELGRLDVGPRAAVISHHLWQKAFAGASDVVGKHVVLVGYSTAKDPRVIVEIVGVAGRGFRGTQADAPQDIWLDWSGWRGILFPDFPDISDSDAADMTEMETVVRLKEGRSLSSVMEELGALAPSTIGISNSEARLVIEPGIAVNHRLRDQYQQRSAIYQFISILLLVTSAAAMAAIQVLEYARTQHSDLIRGALGETSIRRLRRELLKVVSDISPPILFAFFIGISIIYSIPTQSPVPLLPIYDKQSALSKFMTEAALLWLAVLLLILSVRLLMRVILPRTARLNTRTARRKLLFMPAAVAILTVAIIVAGALASFFVLNKLKTRHFGFDSDSLSIVRVRPDSSIAGGLEHYLWRQMSERQLDALIFRLEESLPSRYALASASPFEPALVRQIKLNSDSDQSKPSFVFVNEVSRNYFRVTGGKILAGTDLSWSGSGAEVLVSEKFAKRYLRDTDPLGARFSLQTKIGTSSFEDVTIVGVVNDFHRDSPRSEPTAMVYRPLRHEGGLWVGITSHVDSPAMHTAMNGYLNDAGGGNWLAEGPARLSSEVEQAYRFERSETILLIIAAIGLAGLGFAAIVSMLRSSILERASEFAIRRALGASSKRLALATIQMPPAILALLALLALPVIYRVTLHAVAGVDGRIALFATSAAAACLIGCWFLALLTTVNDTTDRRLLDSLKRDGL